MVDEGKETLLFLGDVFQIVLSRRFRQKFSGDEFNVYRALRRINPRLTFSISISAITKYLVHHLKQLIVSKNKAIYQPNCQELSTAGDDEKDRQLAIDFG